MFLNSTWYCICYFFYLFVTGKFIDVVAWWGGSTHDAHIFRTSPLRRRLEAHRGIQDGILLGDSGYACKPYLLTPYLHPSTVAQERYNSAHKRTRAQIERAFGWLKRRFHVLHGEIRMAPERVCTLIGRLSRACVRACVCLTGQLLWNVMQINFIIAYQTRNHS